jgi:very-short-patch-repair endonuclease
MQIDIQRDRARTMRKSMTGAERKLWSALKGKALSGYRFNRQVEIGGYIVDFLCRKCRVIVEIDGVTHSDAQEVTSDKRRTEYLEAKDYTVFRAWNNEVYTNLEGMLQALLQILESRTR